MIQVDDHQLNCSTTTSMVSWSILLLFIIIIYALYWCYKHNASLNYKILRNQNVILTGASSGIGEQMAYELAKGGCNLIITGLEQNLLESVAQKCKALGATSVNRIAIDFSPTQNCRKFVSKCLSIFKDGKIDYLFLNHNCGLPYKEWINIKNADTFDIDKNIDLVDKVIPININSHMIIATLLYKQLETSQGRIIYTSSLSGYGIQPYVSVYSAAKHALSSFFENWRLELDMNKSKMSITICKVALVATETGMKNTAGILSDSIVKNAANPNYVATRIISGGQKRLRFVYVPFRQALGTSIIIRISMWLYMKITCKVNYNRFW